MIILQIQGGLGNQLFQYAMAKSLSCRLGKQLYLDISFYRYSQEREYNLDFFPNIVERPILGTKRDYDKLMSIKSYINRLNDNYEDISVVSYSERTAMFNVYNVFPLFTEDLIYMKGYFQSEMYFGDIGEDIRNIFSVGIPNQYNKLLQQIRQTESVAVHFRRGDYVTSPHAAGFYVHCSMGYYQKSIEFISHKVSKPLSLFIFSDDIQWVKANFYKVGCPVVFIENSVKQHPAIPLLIMSKCKHQITANSSYSWWAAWLNNNPFKIVCTPERWFKEVPNGDLVPDDWIRIKN